MRWHCIELARFLCPSTPFFFSLSKVEITSRSEAHIRFISLFGGPELPVGLPRSRWMVSPQTPFLYLHYMTHLAQGEFWRRL
jgi:hypothetical protein